MAIETGRGVSKYGCPSVPTDLPACFRLDARRNYTTEETHALRYLNQLNYVPRRESEMHHRRQRQSVKLTPVFEVAPVIDGVRLMRVRVVPAMERLARHV